MTAVFFRHVRLRGTGYQEYIYSILRTNEVKAGTVGVSLIQASSSIHICKKCDI